MNEAKVITLAFLWVVAIPALLGVVYLALHFLFQNTVIAFTLWTPALLTAIWGALFISKIFNLHETD